MSTTDRAGRTRSLPPRRYLAVTALAVLGVVGALIGPAVYGAWANPSAKDKIAADPPPSLFPAAAIHRVDALTDAQPARAAALLRPWWAQHGSAVNDTAFVSWLESSFPAPPTATERGKEMVELIKLDAARTPTGITAATWLETYGKKDVWKLAVHDQEELLSGATGGDRKSAEKDLLDMAKSVADTLSATYQLSAPYVARPSLRTDKTVPSGSTCPCSYPSKHAAAAAASRTLLGDLMPQRDAEYRWWQDQIDYSRLYMAGHYASDITGGTLLGDLIGDYFLVTREGISPDRLPGVARR